MATSSTSQPFASVLRTGIALILSYFLGSSAAIAAPFTDLVIFGDSLSDNGNAAYIFKEFPDLIPADLPAPQPPLYTSGRYTNGPDVTPGTAYQGTWVEQLAAMLGLTDPTPGLPNFIDQTLPPGNNLAVAGASTNDGSPVSIANMVSTYLSAQPGGLSNTTLYVLFGGANDLFRAPDPVAEAQLAVASIFANVQALHDAGARTFLVPNLPDLGTTPRAVQSGKVAELHDASVAYKNAWTVALAGAQSKGLNVVGVDLYDLYSTIIANPAAFGLTNVTDPAQGNTFADDHLFWDILHPTTTGHSLIAGAAYDALNPVPEPMSVVLVGAGIGWIIWRHRNSPRVANRCRRARSA